MRYANAASLHPMKMSVMKYNHCQDCLHPAPLLFSGFCWYYTGQRREVGDRLAQLMLQQKASYSIRKLSNLFIEPTHFQL